MHQYVAEVIKKHANNIPEKYAYRTNEVSVTWKQYYAEINQITNSFLKKGLKRGDKIATLLPQSPAFMNIYMAAANMGLILVPLDLRYTTSEMIELCERTAPKLLLFIANNEEINQNVKEFLEQYPIPLVYSYLGEPGNISATPYDELLEHPYEPIDESLHPFPKDPLVIVFTSGSTGRPKGAILTHENTLTMVEQAKTIWEIDDNDSMLINLPTSHVGGTHTTLAIQLYAGATGIILPKFNPTDVLNMIDKFKITFFGGVATMFRLVFQMCDPANYDLSSVRLVFFGGEKASFELMEKVQKVFPNGTLITSWGMTETTGPFTLTTLDETVDTISKSAGKAALGLQLKILKDNKTFGSPNEIGEIVVKGNSVISTYLNKEDNDRAFIDGWLKTGDLGYLDDNERLYFVGRSKEMYISGGYNVYPLEIESYINAHPKVNTSCIIDVPDDTWGEVGIAFIVPVEGINLSVEEITNYCKKGLANYKRPKKVIIRNDLPKTLIGKIAKQDIKNNKAKYIS